jgi:hypothetical protein
MVTYQIFDLSWSHLEGIFYFYQISNFDMPHGDLVLFVIYDNWQEVFA